MDEAQLAFSDHEHPALSGSIVLEANGRISLRASAALGKTLDAAAALPATPVGPLHFDSPKRGVSLAAALAKGVRAGLVECELVAGAFEIRGYLGGVRTRLWLQPGDFDSDDAWSFLLAWNDAKLETARP